MSVYNAERHLREAIESILSQTFSDLEFVIVDDASTDSTTEILRRYAKQDKRIRLARNASNLGLTRSLNIGLGLAQGEYIARLDADDISLPDRLKLQTCFADANPQVGAFGGAVEIIDEQGRFLGKTSVPSEHEALQAQLLVDNCFFHSTVMMRRRLVQRLGGYDERLPYAQDYELWWRLSRVARLAALPEALVRLRFSGESITGLYRQEQLQSALEISLRAVRECLGGRLLHEEAYQRFWWACHKRYSRLRAGDIQRLHSLWELLDNHRGWRQVWRRRLLSLAYHLLKHQRTTEGIQLLWILMRRFGEPVEWCFLFKELAEAYVTTSRRWVKQPESLRKHTLRVEIRAARHT